MDLPRQFDPPDTVVAPAFVELLSRLREARASGLSPSVNDEERRLFEDGVAARRRVLEHTLLLTFGQWAVYRQAISRVPYRGIRIAYGVGAFFATTAFARSRASAVWRDLFAHIATSPLDSAIANEARVVLAELEGPDGPYFRALCRERGFSHDLGAVVASLDAESDEISSAPPQHDVHAQLRLRPRLLEHHPHSRHHPQGSGDSPEMKQQKQKQKRYANTQGTPMGASGTGRPGVPSPSGLPVPVLDSWPAPPTHDDSWDMSSSSQNSPARPPFLVRTRTDPARRVPKTKEDGESNGDFADNNINFDSNGTAVSSSPFDFSAAATTDSPWSADDSFDFRASDNSREREDANNERGFDTLDDREILTPSQRRAAERRTRRERARASYNARAVERDAE